MHAAMSMPIEPRRVADRVEKNRLLLALPQESRARLEAHLAPVSFSTRDVLWQADGAIERVVFPRTCVVSIIVPLKSDQAVESATIGFEGFAGVPVVLGARSTNTTALVQIPGEAAAVPSTRLRALVQEDEGLRDLFLRYSQVLLDQTSQAVACNRRHSMEERCARWLLTTHDRVGGQQFPLTQEFLAQMLGVRRASVTVAAGMLQKAGFIRYSRGRVTIVDREGLEASSCECYRASWDTYHRQLGL